jgi:hypothetical protein
MAGRGGRAGVALAPVTVRLAGTRRRHEAGTRSARRAALSWPFALTALVGAWLGHFLEYVRVSGWSSAVPEMTSSVHAYFFPAGIGLLAVVAFGGGALGRIWAVLGRRLAAAEAGRWRQPTATATVAPARPTRVVRRGPSGVARTTLILTVLQLGIWLVQENLEAVGAGQRAPWLGVLGGVHLLAPVVEVEVALILATVYCFVQRALARRAGAVEVIERFLARRWNRAVERQLAVCPTAAPQWSPLQRWGAPRWQRPPPGLGVSVSICA